MASPGSLRLPAAGQEVLLGLLSPGGSCSACTVPYCPKPPIKVIAHMRSLEVPSRCFWGEAPWRGYGPAGTETLLRAASLDPGPNREELGSLLSKGDGGEGLTGHKRELGRKGEDPS